MANPYEGINFWVYLPSKTLAFIFLFAFLVTAAIHYWQCRHYKFFRVTWSFVVGGILYVIGFALRLNGAYGNYDELVPFIISVALIYVSPPLLALGNYDILGRIFYYAPYLSPMEPGRVLSTFVLLSLAIESVNGLAASFIANPDSNPILGSAFTWTALVLQILAIVVFLGLAGFFHWKCVKAGISGARGIKIPLITLYVSSGLILIRTIYRGVEHSVTTVAEIEWPFYVFEVALMLLNMVIWNIWHPGLYLPADTRTYLSKDTFTEVKGPERKDTRSRTAKILDPFHIMELCRRREKPRDEAYLEIDESGNEVRHTTPV
ncbi:hypothetical protein M426DRAFT_13926 [Hypoxylon sp. CI-4A]|nr:hypothetical protein M426DRAFT_13926 [Hypoxylon sp. CI-4A]